MMSPGEFAQRLKLAAVRAREEITIPTEEAMSEVAARAKEVVGTYAYGWPQLADRTQEDRVALGFPANEPLLRTGGLRDSIEHRAEPTAIGAEGLVYSDAKEALWAEMGTSRGEPPRSFLMQSLVRSEAKIAAIFGAFAMKLLQGL